MSGWMTIHRGRSWSNIPWNWSRWWFQVVNPIWESSTATPKHSGIKGHHQKSWRNHQKITCQNPWPSIFWRFSLFKMCNLCFTMISWALLFFLTPRIFWSSAATTSFTCWGVGLFFSTFAWGANLGHSAVGGGKEAWSYHVFVCFSSCGKRISMGNGGFSKRWRILQLWSCGATCRYLFSGLM